MNCETCFAPLPVIDRDPVLLRPIYGPCVKCAESHEQGWRDFMDIEQHAPGCNYQADTFCNKCGWVKSAVSS